MRPKSPEGAEKLREILVKKLDIIIETSQQELESKFLKPGTLPIKTIMKHTSGQKLARWCLG